MESKGGAEKPAPRRWRRRVAIAAGVLVVLGGATYFGVHHTTWMGPMLADGLRAVFGQRFVAWAEDTVYTLQDKVNAWRYRDAKPTTFWEPPPAATSPSGAASTASAGAAAPTFSPPPFAPPFERTAAPGDGQWTPVADEVASDAPPAMWKSLVHPDPTRTYAALAVVAIDRAAVELHLVAGTAEPWNPEIPKKERPAVVPSEDQPRLIAAFNGGFKAEHGHYGMRSEGKEFIAPRDIACTVATYDDGRLAIAPWSVLKSQAPERIRFYRQTPPCLVQGGDPEKRLSEYSDYSRLWGVSVSGETVIRRSAVGISKDGKTLYFGLGESMSAQSLALGMKVVGSDAAAQLDVNHSFPRFLFYGKDEAGQLTVKSGLIPGSVFSRDQYLKPSDRDFFYLTRAPGSSSRQAAP